MGSPATGQAHTHRATGRGTGKPDVPEGELARLVRDALGNLHDPVYLQTHRLARGLPTEGQARGTSLGQALRRTLVDAIETLRPTDGAPGSEAWRAYQILALRYVEALEPPAVQRELAIGRSQFFREQRRALAAVTSLLRERLTVPGDATTPAELGAQAAAELAAPTSPGSEALPAAPGLPVALTSFVGREREIAEVWGLLRTSRLLTLTGSGGCGKTRLALEVAARVESEYGDGARLVEMASLADEELVPQTVAFALGVRDEREQPLVRAVIRYLQPRQVLLVLDNCEHLLLACSRLVEEMLQACPRLRILATSREALGIGAETRWRVPSLEAPPESVAGPEEAAGYEAVNLFVERARAVEPGFAVTAANAEHVARICRRLDGIPLAIELAAALMRLLLPAQVAARLDDRFGLLVQGSRTALRRQQTLRATIDWSYDLLLPAEKTLFRRLAIFAGGWTIDAATAVCSGSGVESEQVLALLAGLIDKSLVVVEPSANHLRYRYLETIRQYALERLVVAREDEGTRQRHRDWYVALGERAFTELIGPSHTVWIDLLETEHENLRAALEHCQKTDPEGGICLAGGVWRFWRARGYVGEGRRWLSALLEPAGEPTRQRARAFIGAGILTYEQGDHDSAVPLLEHGERLAREVNDKHAIASALQNLAGLALIRRQNPQTTRANLEESLRLTREIGDSWGEGFAHLFLGRLAVSEGLDQPAMELIEKGVALLRETGDAWNFASALWDMAWLGLSQGQYGKAQAHLEEMRDIAVKMGDRQMTGFALLGMAMVSQAQGRHHDAHLLLRETIGLFHEIGSPGILDAMSELGHLLVQRGQHVPGVRLLAAGYRERLSHGSWRILLYQEAAQDRWETSEKAARVALGADAYREAWDEGARMTVEQATGYALSASLS